MRDHVAFVVLLGLVTLAALAFRVAALDNRPMHADEAVQAARFHELWERGRYVYDPDEYHGPTLPFATLPFVWCAAPRSFAETTAATYRIVPAVLGCGLILLLWPLADALGKPAAFCAGLLTAIAPAMVFFSRYYIHETLLVFFSLAAIAFAWRYVRSGKLPWCLACGTCLGLMQATKETSVLAFGAAGVATALAFAWNRISRSTYKDQRPAICLRHLGFALLAATCVTVVLLSSFFTNPRGPWDGVLTYLPWLSRAGGLSPHVHPWYFYLRILAYWQAADGPRWSELLILLLAGAGIVTAFWPHGYEHPGANMNFARWIALYTLLLTAAYSAIPYKTPWCLLEFLQGMILLAGIGAASLVRKVPGLPLKCLLVLGLLAAGGHLAWQSYRASFTLCADPRNPYVYAHTLPDAQRLSRDLEQLTQASPEGNATPVHVIWHDGYYWPLPWYLRRCTRVGYWTQMPVDPSSPLVVSSPQFDVALSAELGATHLMTGYYALRPNVLVQLWVRMDVWESHLRRLGRL